MQSPRLGTDKVLRYLLGYRGRGSCFTPAAWEADALGNSLLLPRCSSPDTDQNHAGLPRSLLTHLAVTGLSPLLLLTSTRPLT